MPMGAGGVVASLYMAVVLGLFGLNCLRCGIGGGGVGVPCAVESLLEHRSESSMCVYCNRGKVHLIVEEISNDVIT